GPEWFADSGKSLNFGCVAILMSRLVPQPRLRTMLDHARYRRIVPLATVLTDPEWLSRDLERAARMYPPAADRILGTIRWYSISSVLVGASLEPLVRLGTAMEPTLEAVTLDISAQG